MNVYSHLSIRLSMDKNSTLRPPKQERGKQRVALILEAAAQVFAEYGYEATTTILIAERANTSVGSLYQFFPNKDAIVRVLVDHYVEQTRLWFETIPVQQFAPLSLPEMVGILVDSMREFTRQNKDFLRLFCESQSSTYLAQAIQAVDDEIYHQFDAVFAIRSPHLTDHERLLHHLVVLNIMKSMIALAANSPVQSHDEVYEELKNVLIRYMAPITGMEARPDLRGNM
jgi:AcrR family transcriptional regulator